MKELCADHLPIAIITVDRQSTITYCNTAAHQLFGYEEGELVGQSLNVLVPPESREKHEREAEKYWRHPVYKPLGIARDLFGLCKDGQKIQIEISLFPYGNQIVVFLVNIHIRLLVQNLQNTLADLQKKLQQIVNHLEIEK